jgi:branched-chain amino acid aminotransferase
MFDNSLLYAEGLFETFLAIRDRLIFRDDHLRRLLTGAKVIGLKLPVGMTTLKKWLREAAAAHPAEVKKVRLTVTAGESAKWVGTPGEPQVAIGVSPHELPEQPYKLQVSRFGIDQKSVFRSIKTISYAIHAAALRKAQKAGFDDALMINNREEVAESTSANVFWVKKRRLYTTPLGSGCLDGVTRKNVIRLAKKLGIPFAERQIRLERLVQADEAFVSSSLKLVLPIGLISEGRRKYRFAATEITQQLRETIFRLQRISL